MTPSFVDMGWALVAWLTVLALGFTALGLGWLPTTRESDLIVVVGSTTAAWVTFVLHRRRRIENHRQ